MRNPKIVLDNLTQNALKESYKYNRLYRNLYNEEFYYMAYNKISSKEGNMTEGSDNETIDGMSKERIYKLIESIKDESYKPKPAKRIYIPKKNGDKRPLGLPSIDDKIIQEIVRNILQSIYEPKFSNNSHGFRPNRSCHTALMNISRYNGVKWYIEGDIKGFFDNINHHILIDILKENIQDEKFINLIWKFLRAGYLENWKINNSYSGTPQGGIISPILANIYLDKLDKYMENYVTDFNRGKKRPRNPAYRRLEYEISKAEKQLICENNNVIREEVLANIKDLKQEKLNTAHFLEMDDCFKRLSYTRYADDFLIGVIGSKEDAMEIKQNIKEFLNDYLKLELSENKTLVTHSENKVRFLGYDITVNKSNEYKRKNLNGKVVKQRTMRGDVKLLMPQEAWLSKLKEYEAMEVIQKNGKEEWKPKHRTYLINNDDLEIFKTYNAEIRGLYNYYRLALNVSSLNSFYYIMQYSFAKTMGCKHKISVKKVFRKFNIDGKLGIRYDTKKGSKICYFYNEGFKRNKTLNKYGVEDNPPNTTIYANRTSLSERLKADSCEWCDKTNTAIEIHHVRKLKDLKGKKKWEKHMIARQRKTLALCIECHDKLHSRMLD